jgi:hypothetical protein
MYALRGGPKYQNKIPSEKNRKPLARREAQVKVAKSSPVTPHAIVTTL